MLYLVIAREGDYSNKKTWVVQAFTDEALAVEEAARLNARIPIEVQLRDDYGRRRSARREELTKFYEVQPNPWVSSGATGAGRYYHLSIQDRNAIEARLDDELGPRPEDLADDYTVVAIPVGERGKWDLP